MPSEVVAITFNKENLLKQIRQYYELFDVTETSSQQPLSSQNTEIPEITVNENKKDVRITEEDRKLRELLNNICNGKYSNQ